MSTMMKSLPTTRPNEVPASACMFYGDMDVVTNPADEGNMVPVRMIARSGNAINHWFWGKVAHDFDGLIKPERAVPIDYCHDDQQILGYADQFNVTPAGLECAGKLVLIDQGGGRAREVLYNWRHGVPYESSIYFDAEQEIRIQEIGEGETVMVNGQPFAGPGIVIRQWKLRGVAICPYGYDPATSTQFKRESDRMVRVQFFSQKEEEMANKNAQPIEPLETISTTEPAKYTAEDIQQFAAFGPEGVTWMLEGKTLADCEKLHAAKQVEALQAKLADQEKQLADLAAKNAELQTKLSAASAAAGEVNPASFSPAAPENKPRRLADTIVIPGRRASRN